jgi:hypothetical protein
MFLSNDGGITNKMNSNNLSSNVHINNHMPMHQQQQSQPLQLPQQQLGYSIQVPYSISTLFVFFIVFYFPLLLSSVLSTFVCILFLLCISIHHACFLLFSFHFPSICLLLYFYFFYYSSVSPLPLLCCDHRCLYYVPHRCKQLLESIDFSAIFYIYFYMMCYDMLCYGLMILM